MVPVYAEPETSPEIVIKCDASLVCFWLREIGFVICGLKLDDKDNSGFGLVSCDPKKEVSNEHSSKVM